MARCADGQLFLGWPHCGNKALGSGAGRVVWMAQWVVGLGAFWGLKWVVRIGRYWGRVALYRVGVLWGWAWGYFLNGAVRC